MSRALGDLQYRQYGLISEPEITPWIELNKRKAEHLVLASDGLVEGMTETEACQAVHHIASGLLSSLCEKCMLTRCVSAPILSVLQKHNCLDMVASSG